MGDGYENGFDEGDFMDDPDCNFCDDGLNAEMQESSKDEDNGIDIGWEEIAMFGALSEEIADEGKERLRIEREMDKDKDQDDL